MRAWAKSAVSLSPASPRDSLGNPAEGWVGGDILANEERSDEYRLKGRTKRPKPKDLKQQKKWSGPALRRGGRRPDQSRQRRLQGRTKSEPRSIAAASKAGRGPQKIIIGPQKNASFCRAGVFYSPFQFGLSLLKKVYMPIRKVVVGRKDLELPILDFILDDAGVGG
ncbi:hypothetical protein SapgrDRAFT_2090 [Saprospira grandis DSM 2844]|uniref:Uncharacterized protein n=1 Tax=Saprospira grandis DSM 2844 TaxID=694433 RepID=J1I4W1_9BACT|nr:hypothetical protein SapgrDRAFT_2090 [Saprospira grandis DSM 2844]